jgi:hypothetical protein
VDDPDQVLHAFEWMADLRFIGHYLLDYLSQQVGALEPAPTGDTRQFGSNLFGEPERELCIGSFSHALHFALHRRRGQADTLAPGNSAASSAPMP